MTDTRQKYDVTVILRAGQAVNVVTFMPPKEVEREVWETDNQYIVLDGIGEASGKKVHASVLRSERVGLLISEHVEQPRLASAPPGMPRIVQ